MTQEKANEIFATELGRKLNVIYVTSDDQEFIHYEEAALHTNELLNSDPENFVDTSITERFIDLRFGDMFEQMKMIPDKSIDFICCDLPYQKTKNSWDCLIPFDLLWKAYERIIKNNGCIVLFGQDKFSAKLMLSNEKLHRYNLIWEKTTPTGHLNSKKMPLRNHEDMLVFYKSLPTYNPQKTTGHKRKVSMAIHKRNSKKTSNYGEHKLTSYDSTERYPKSVWRFSTDKQKESLHPTQKPVLLIEELIKTFTNENDIVLDNAFGSCTTGIACINTNRNFIGIENNIDYFNISSKRIEEKIKDTQFSIMTLI